MSTQPQVNKIRIENPPIENEVRTYLTLDCVAGATTIYTLDNSGFTITGTSDYYIIIGEYGNEKTEIVLVDANGAGTNNNGFTIGATKYSHEASDPVTFIRYNQIRFYGATSSGGTKDVLNTKDIETSQVFTEITYEGSAYSYFYSAYYNSNDDKISAYSDEIENTSYTRRSVKRIIESGLRKALTTIDNNADGKLTWDTTLEILQDGIDEIIARKRRWSFLRSINSSISTASGVQYISGPSDLSLLEFIFVDGKQINPLSRSDFNLYTSNSSSGTPNSFVFKNNKYYLYPTPNAVYSVIFEYYRRIATITSNLATEIDIPFVPILIYYCGSQFAYIRGNDKRGDKLYQMFVKLLEDQVIEFSGPDQTGVAEYVETTSNLNEEDDLLII